MTMHNPPHPGEFIRETYIEPFDISIRSLAENLGVAASTLARIVSERSALSPEMASRLSKALGQGAWPIGLFCIWFSAADLNLRASSCSRWAYLSL